MAAADGLFVPSTDPAGVVTQFTDGGPAVQAAARQALLKGGQSIEDFISTGQHDAITEDYRLIALRLSLVGGRVVREKAEAALTGNDPDALRAFVTDGWKSAWALDDRAAAFVPADRGTPTVKRETNKALDSTDPNAVSNLMLIGQHKAKIIDDRAATYALASTGSPSVVAAAEAALDATLPDGSDDTQAVADFLRYGQFVAGARDAESATIKQLTTQAIAANAVAQEEKLKADEASAQAVLSARLAKEAAQRAAQQATAAQGNAAKASAAASVLVRRYGGRTQSVGSERRYGVPAPRWIRLLPQRSPLIGRKMQFLKLPELRIDEASPDVVGAFVVTLDEIAVLANAIAQARLAIDDWEFSSLVGVEPDEADQIKKTLVHVLRTHHSPQT